MKYKVYPVIFILTLLGFMSIFGGITDIEEDVSNGCTDSHSEVTFGESEMISNGNEAIVTQTVTSNCLNGYWDNSASCSDDYKCSSSDFSHSHYNDSVTVSVLQNGSVVQTVSAEIESTDSSNVIINTLTFAGPGDYVLRYTIVCDGTGEDREGSVVSTHDEPITITEGVTGNFDLIGMAITCDSTGNSFQFDETHFTGTNAISIENMDFNLQLNMAAEIDTVEYPCVESSFEVDESGTFGTDGNTATISYVDGSATVSQTFTYTYDGQYFSILYAEPNEDAVAMTFKKQTP